MCDIKTNPSKNDAVNDYSYDDVWDSYTKGTLLLKNVGYIQTPAVLYVIP